MLRTVVLLNLVKSMIIYHDSLSIFWQFNASLLNPLILQKKQKQKTYRVQTFVQWCTLMAYGSSWGSSLPVMAVM